MGQGLSSPGSGLPGSDLFVEPGPGLPQGLLIPAAELQERFSRSSGPGGQSVNTTDSRVELGYADIWVVVSDHRSQHRNRVLARERLAARVREAHAPPPLPRVPTKPSRGAKRRRLEGKRRRSQVKSMRRRVDPG